jgi:hypothetical protein
MGPYNRELSAYVTKPRKNDGKKLWAVTMQLTCIEEEGIEYFSVNIQKNNFIQKLSSQTEGHNTIYYTTEKWSWYVDWTQLA